MLHGRSIWLFLPKGDALPSADRSIRATLAFELPKIIEQIQEERLCTEHEKWIPGTSPKELQQMLMHEELRKQIEESRRLDIERQDARDRENREWQAKQERERHNREDERDRNVGWRAWKIALLATCTALIGAGVSYFAIHSKPVQPIIIQQVPTEQSVTK